MPDVLLPADPIPNHRLSLDKILEGSRHIDPLFLATPLIVSEPLATRLGCDLGMKVETLGPIRSFKGRGADWFVRTVVETGVERPLVCASTGNFGQAMAWAGRKHGRRVVVYADRNANPLKVGRIRDLGGEVRQVGDDFDEAKAMAKDFCSETGAWMIEDGAEPVISEGAGSIGVEMTRAGSWDVVLVPVGNGALINGVARWLKAAAPLTRIVGVCAAGADSMEKSWREGRVVERESVDTVAEGVAVRTPVPEAVADMTDLVDDMTLVDDQNSLEALRLIAAHTGLIVEPAAALGVAAVMSQPGDYRNLHVATVLTGSNLTVEQIGRWLAEPA